MSPSTYPISRSGQISRVNRLISPTRVPAVIAPCSIRQTPITSRATVARAGRASRLASKLAVTRAASMRASRSSSALSAKRRPSASSAWRALTTRAPSKLSWATADMSPSRSWPRVVGCSTRRWKARLRSRMAGTTSRPRVARNGSARNSHTAAAPSMVSTPVANGSGDRISEAASRSPSARDSSSPAGARGARSAAAGGSAGPGARAGSPARSRGRGWRRSGG